MDYRTRDNEIISMRNNGYTFREIGEHFNISGSAVSMIYRREIKYRSAIPLYDAIMSSNIGPYNTKKFLIGRLYWYQKQKGIKLTVNDILSIDPSDFLSIPETGKRAVELLTAFKREYVT